MSKQKWDLTSTHSLEGAAGWIRKRSGALLVLVIRPNDVAFDVDPNLAPVDAIATVREEMPGLLQHLMAQRQKRKSAGAQQGG